MFKVRTYLINFSLVCLDLTLTAACYLAVLWGELRPQASFTSWRALLGGYLLVLGCVLAVLLGSLFYFQMYQSRRMHSVFADLVILVKAALASLVLLEALAHFAGALYPSRLFLVRFTIANLLILGLARVGVRICLRHLRSRGFNSKGLLVVASPELSGRLCRKLAQTSHYGYRVVGPIEFDRDRPDSSVLTIEKFGETLRTSQVDDVILGLSAEAHQLAARLVGECESRGINVRLVPDLFPLIQTDTQVYDLGGLPLINIRLYPTEYFGYVVLKRGLDVVTSLAVLTLLLPLFLLVAVLIKLTSPGPILLAQERMGLNGRKFKMLKFRTMRSAATRHRDTHWTRPNDPDVTPFGRWLRRSSLDELPQFINVLKGDMSLVGPRPERPFFIEQFRQEVPGYMLRHYVKCGITGWAQVNGWRGDTSIRERLAHDLYYMQHWALSFDLKILTLTLLRSFFHPNAY
jgi:Undecaprenyl-phosphate glucose phosphotransferase